MEDYNDNFDEIYQKMMEANDTDAAFAKVHKMSQKYVGKYSAEFDSGADKWVLKEFGKSKKSSNISS